MTQYKQQKPLRSTIRVEQPLETPQRVKIKNLDRNFQPMSDVEGGFFLSHKTNKAQDYSHTNSESSNPSVE